MGYLLGEPLPDLFRKANKAVPELIPGLEMGHSFGPEDLREALGFSLTLRQAKVSAWLTKLPREGYTQNTVETSEINFLLAEAMQEGAKKNRKSFVASVKKLRPALAPKRLIVSPRVELALFRPEVELFESVASGDSARLAEAWKAKGDAWKKAYAKASEQRNADAILDVVALGVARIGEGFGMKVPPTHPYAPLELLT